MRLPCKPAEVLGLPLDSCTCWFREVLCPPPASVGGAQEAGNPIAATQVGFGALELAKSCESSKGNCSVVMVYPRTKYLGRHHDVSRWILEPQHFRAGLVHALQVGNFLHTHPLEGFLSPSSSPSSKLHGYGCPFLWAFLKRARPTVLANPVPSLPRVPRCGYSDQRAPVRVSIPLSFFVKIIWENLPPPHFFNLLMF